MAQLQNTIINDILQVGAGSINDLPIKFKNDTDTGIICIDSDSILFVTGGTEKLRINNSGKVGLTQSNPTDELDIRGSIRSGLINQPQLSIRTSNNEVNAFEFYFRVVKGVSGSRNVDLINITTANNFHQATFTCEYGNRIQAFGLDSQTRPVMRQYGVNKSGTNPVTLSQTINIQGAAVDNNNLIVTPVMTGNSSYSIQVQFSSSLGASSFVAGCIRGYSSERNLGTITFNEGSNDI